MYSGIVFDFDGVLYDSEKHWEVIENRYLIERVPAWNSLDYKNLIGHSLPEAYTYLRSRGLSLNEDEYFTDYYKMAEEVYSKFAEPLKNISVLLHSLAMRKIKLAIASSSRRAWIDMALQNRRLPVAFEVIVSGDHPSVHKGKPAPDVYLVAADLLGEHPSKLIAIEDSKYGVASAKKAGLYCFGLRNGFNDDQDLSEADSILDGYSTEDRAQLMGLIV